MREIDEKRGRLTKHGTNSNSRYSLAYRYFLVVDTPSYGQEMHKEGDKKERSEAKTLEDVMIFMGI